MRRCVICQRFHVLGGYCDGWQYQKDEVRGETIPDSKPGNLAKRIVERIDEMCGSQIYGIPGGTRREQIVAEVDKILKGEKS